MYKEKAVGKSKEEARKKAEEALKERLWKECWRESVELRVSREEAVEVCGMWEVELEV